MVKKLLKYEAASYVRTMLPMLLILLGMGVLTRFVQIFEARTTAYSIVFVSSVVALVITSLVCLVMSMVVSVVRFRSSLYTAEGYLYFTLPVTPMQHLFSKLLSAVICILVSCAAVIAALAVAGAGDMTEEVVKAGVFLLNILAAKVGTLNTVLYVVEGLILIIVSFTESLLLFYGCISLGQRAKKNRLLAAFGIYFAYYFARQILGTVFIIVFSCMVYEHPQFIGDIAEWATTHYAATTHIALCGEILLTALLGFVYGIINLNVMKKHLNLE